MWASVTDYRLELNLWSSVTTAESFLTASNIHLDDNNWPDQVMRKQLEDISSLPGICLSALQTLLWIQHHGVNCLKTVEWGGKGLCVCASGLPEKKHVQSTKVTCSSSTQYAVSAGSQWFYLRLSMCDREREGQREENKINTHTHSSQRQLQH